MARFHEGQRVRFTADNLGLMARDGSEGLRFSREEQAHAGEEGDYHGPHPSLPDWHDVIVVRGGREYVCPVHLSMIEAAT